MGHAYTGILTIPAMTAQLSLIKTGTGNVPIRKKENSIMRIIGNCQRRETLEEAGMKLISRRYGEAVLEDETGKRELWVLNDDYCGYVIEIDGDGFEFVCSIPAEYKGD
jgi:hypothetical protein